MCYLKKSKLLFNCVVVLQLFYLHFLFFLSKTAHNFKMQSNRNILFNELCKNAGKTKI